MSSHPAAVTHPSAADQETLVSQMVEMGFQRALALQALQTCNWSIELAIDHLQQQQQHNGQVPVISAAARTEQDKPVLRLPVNNPFADSPNSSDRTNEEEREMRPAQEALVYIGDKLRSDSEEARMRFKEKMRQAELQKLKEERAERRRRLQIVRQQIKVERRQRMTAAAAAAAAEPSSSSSNATTGSSSSSSSSSSASSDVRNCQLQVRLPDSSLIRPQELPAMQSTDTLEKVAQCIEEKRPDLARGSYSLLVAFPRKEFTHDQFDSVTLQEAGLAPRGSLVVQQIKDKGKLQKGEAMPTRRIYFGVHDDDDDDDDGDGGDDGDNDGDRDDRVFHTMEEDDDDGGGDIGSTEGVMRLLLSTDIWCLSVHYTKLANTTDEQEDNRRRITLVFKPNTDAEFSEVPETSKYKLGFFGSGVMSFVGNWEGHTQTISMNFEVRQSGNGHSLSIVDSTGSRHNADILVLTRNSLIVKLPDAIVPGIDRIIS